MPCNLCGYSGHYGHPYGSCDREEVSKSKQIDRPDILLFLKDFKKNIWKLLKGVKKENLKLYSIDCILEDTLFSLHDNIEEVYQERKTLTIVVDDCRSYDYKEEDLKRDAKKILKDITNICKIINKK